MTVNDIKNFIDWIANKYQSGSYNGDEYNSALQFVNLELLKLKIGIPEDYQIGQYKSRQAWQVTNKISDDLRLVVAPIPIAIDASGYFPYPATYAAYSTMTYDYYLNSPTGGKPTYQERPVELVTDAERVIRTGSNSIKIPTLKYPIAAIYNSGFRVWPADIKRINLTCISIPTKPVWAFTINANDEEIYDPTNSIQLQWPETVHTDFAIRICAYLGWNLRDDDLVKLSELRKQAGQ